MTGENGNHEEVHARLMEERDALVARLEAVETDLAETRAELARLEGWPTEVA